jgi:hypothetical protein
LVGRLERPLGWGPNSGKSWVAGLLSEQLIQLRYSVCVIDQGDYAGLEGLPGVVRIGGTAVGPTPRELRAALRYPDVNVVVDAGTRAADDR